MRKDLNHKFNLWLRSGIGQELLKIEYKLLKKIKQVRPKENMVIVGEPEQQHLFKAYAATNNILITTLRDESVLNGCKVIAYPDELPLMPNSVDFILLPHTLDFNRRIHHTLRDVNICLQPEGSIAIIGFNPYSLWGLRRLLSMRISAPWCGHFQPLWRIKDSLTLLNYEIVVTKKILYRPYAKSNSLFRKLAFLESFFRLIFPFSGAVYVVVAKKKVFGMTPLKLKWNKIPKVLGKSAITSTRTMSQRREQSQ